MCDLCRHTQLRANRRALCCQSARRDGDSPALARSVAALLSQHYHRSTAARRRPSRVLSSCLLTSSTPSHLQERVAELLGRVVVDDGVHARVEVRQAAEEHRGRHVRTVVRMRREEEREKMDVNRQPQQREQHDHEYEHSAGVTLLVLAVTLLPAGSERARRRLLHECQVTQDAQREDGDDAQRKDVTEREERREDLLSNLHKHTRFLPRDAMLARYMS